MNKNQGKVYYKPNAHQTVDMRIELRKWLNK